MDARGSVVPRRTPHAVKDAAGGVMSARA